MSNNCRFCNEPIYNSEGRVYCNDSCKEIFLKLKERIKNQNKEFWNIMNMKCKTCKKKLTEGESHYCSICVDRRNAEKKRAAETGWHRPCKNCGEEMKNPAPNRKWCKECSAIKKRESWVTQAEMNKKRRIKVKEKVMAIDDSTNVVKDQINPKWLEPQGSKRKVK